MLAEKPDTELVVMQPHPQSGSSKLMALIEHLGHNPHMQIETLKELLAVKVEFERDEARKAYVQAMTDFKKEPIVITKDKENKQYSSWYSSIGNWVNTVTPFLSKHGLSAEWTLDQTDGIRVGCTLTHSLGHSGETKWMKVPLDTSGAKNPLQQVKSSITYAKISTFEMATGLASAEGNLDDDGNASGKREQKKTGLSDETVAERIAWIDNSKDLVELQRVHNNACKMAQQADDQKSELAFIKASNTRKVAIREGR